MPRMQASKVGTLLAHSGTMLVVGQALLFYAFVGRARLALGYWPSPYHPDPKDLGFAIHHHAILLLGLPSAVVSPAVLCIGLYAAAKLGASARSRTLAVATYAVAFVVGAGLLYADPGQFGEWFAD